MEKDKKQLEPRSIKIYRGFIVAALVISVSIFLISGTLFVLKGLTHRWVMGGPAEFGYFGSFVGGVLGPAVAASSLLLILKTLKIQMDEMKQTNESLALSAQLNKDNIEQQRNNFVMSWSREHLNQSNLKALKRITYTSIGEIRHPISGHAEFGPVQNFVVGYINATPEKRKTIRPIEGDVIKIEEYLKRLAYLASDAIDFMQSGGNFHHKKDDIAELIPLLQPFRNEVSSLCESLEKLDLNLYIMPLNVAHEKISNLVEEKDKELLRKLES